MVRLQNFICFCLLSSLLFTGCEGKTNSRLRELNGSQIQQLVNCYCFYQARHSYSGPKDEAEFRAFLSESRHKDAFERVGIDSSNIDSLFVSERDGKPYKIKYGLKGSMAGFFEPVVFESEGVDGEVMVGFGGSKSELMSLDESEELYDAKVKKKKKLVRESGPG